MFIELKPIQESPKDYDALEQRLKKFFLDYLYRPLIKELGVSRKTLQNAKPTGLRQALFTGQVTYSGGRFTGKFNSEISKELRALGAQFDRKSHSYKLPHSDIPPDMKASISASEVRFQEKMQKLDAQLSKVVPEELAAQFKCADLFDKTLFKADTAFRKNVEKLAVVPQLSASQRAKISVDWQDNMQLWIKDWTAEQIKDLRKKIYDQVVSGASRESLIPPILKITQTIQGSHEEALNKAKFLARQESRLLMASFKQTRYQDAGSQSYIWRCVHRPHDSNPQQHIPGNVRYSHGLLDGKEYRWASPPVITNPGQPMRRGHPGTDFNCRCFSRPLIRKVTK